MHGDIADAVGQRTRSSSSRTIVVHFAAETHVDRSIMAAGDFIRTDVEGTLVLLEAARRAANAAPLHPDLDRRGLRQRADRRQPETDELQAANPYAASKAGADRLAYSYWATYDVPVIVTRASNNYGPYQFPEKMIPLFVTNAIDDIPVPLYGDGKNVRDWLHVDDHCRAIDLLIERGVDGEVYNIGGGNDVMNVDLTHRILASSASRLSLIKPVADRPGPRPPLLSRHDEAARPRLDAAECRSRTVCGDTDRLVPRGTSGGGGRSRSRTRRSTPTTRRSTSTRQ